MIEIRVPLEARRNPLLTPWTKSLVSFHCESSTVPEESKMKARSMVLRQAIKQRRETQQDTFEAYTWAPQSKQSISTLSAFDIYYSEIIRFYGLRPPSATCCWLISRQSV